MASTTTAATAGGTSDAAPAPAPARPPSSRPTRAFPPNPFQDETEHSGRGTASLAMEDITEHVEDTVETGSVSLSTFSTQTKPTTTTATTTPTQKRQGGSVASSKAASSKGSRSSKTTKATSPGTPTPTIPEPEPEPSSTNNALSSSLRVMRVAIVVLLVASVVNFVISIVALLKDDDNNNGSTLSSGGAFTNLPLCRGDQSPDVDNCQLSSSVVFTSLVEEIRDRGVVRCGVLDLFKPGFYVRTSSAVTGSFTGEGFDVQLCKALSGGLSLPTQPRENNNNNDETATAVDIENGGDDPSLEMVAFATEEDLFEALNASRVDVIMRITHTMERDVYVPQLGTGVEFSTPYFYDGTTVVGVNEQVVACAESGNFTMYDECIDARICVLSDTSSATAIKADPLLESEVILEVASVDELKDQFPSGCAVVAGTALTTQSEFFFQSTLNYQGPLVLGTRMWTREPLAMVTRQGDARWTDFVEAVLQSLVYAEETNIPAREAATKLPLAPSLFGPELQGIFRNAVVAAGGNYGELYAKKIAPIIPRRSGGLNELNRGASPLLWSFPFGNLDTVGPILEDASPTVREIKRRGAVNCGFILWQSFAIFNATTRTYNGVDIDWCRAVSAALFDGDDTRVVYTMLQFPSRFQSLQAGHADLLAMVTTRNLQRDINEPSIQTGVSFSDAYAFVGFSFGGIPPYLGCAENLDVVSAECQDLRVCTIAGTTLVLELVRFLGNDFYVEPVATFEAMVSALDSGDCNAIFASRMGVGESKVRAAGFTGDLYEAGTRVFGLEPLALVTRQDVDPLWSDFVRWLLWALIYAEEEGITQATATAMPRIQTFGPLRADAWYHAVNAVGNYGEIFQRNFPNENIRGVPGQLNEENGPRLYSVPGFDELLQ